MNELAELYRRANPASRKDGSAAAEGIWRRWIGRVADVARRATCGSPAAVMRVAPPLFPIPEEIGVVGVNLVASRNALAELQVPLESSEGVWQLLCNVESDFWYAIIWAIAPPELARSNPIEPLLRAYTRGVYPVGVIEGSLVLFRRSDAVTRTTESSRAQKP